MKAVIDWTTDRAVYESLLDSAGQSSLLQCWAWGEAKAEAEGWRPRRAILSVDGKAVAIAQILEKRAGLIRLGRLNRGPIWLNNGAGDGVTTACLKALRDYYRWWRGGALLMAPELSDGNGGLIQSCGFRPRRAANWNSAWLDLGRDEPELRKALNAKWRNKLVGAEKAGLTIDVVAGADGIAWLLPRYRALMTDRHFAGVSPDVLTAFARHAVKADELLTLRAFDDGGEDAGAVLMARHGAAATYLIGWTPDVGRRTRANHLLLWQAAAELKARGCAWLDLGGIDDVLTPGIATFKRGLNGAEYRLAGEFLGI